MTKYAGLFISGLNSLTANLDKKFYFKGVKRDGKGI